MSIITDALRKAENERELKAKRVSEKEASSATTLTEEEIFPQFPKVVVPHKVEIEDQKTISEIKKFFRNYSPVWKRPVLFVTAIFFLFGLLILALLPKKTVLVVQANKDSNIQKQISSAISNTVQSNLRLPYVLSGISKLGNSQYAIINGMIVQQGDSIDGAHVREILNGEVVLETRAGEIRLKIK